MLLLSARLGLRPSEVLRLRLQDLDWTIGSVLIRAGKTSRERVLPLPEDAGAALARYLHEARPKNRRLGNCNQLKVIFPASSQTTHFWRSCRRSDYAERPQDSVAAPLPFTHITRHNPVLGIRPYKATNRQHGFVNATAYSRAIRSIPHKWDRVGPVYDEPFFVQNPYQSCPFAYC
jgi:hypothetical protein